MFVYTIYAISTYMLCHVVIYYLCIYLIARKLYNVSCIVNCVILMILTTTVRYYNNVFLFDIGDTNFRK